MARLLVPLLALGLLLTACGDDGEEGGTAESTTTDGASATEPTPGSDGGRVGGPADGDVYVATSVAEGGEERPLVAGTEVHVTFQVPPPEADALPSLSVQAGCNHLGVSYDQVGDTAHLGEVTATEMGCATELMDQDAWIASVLHGEVGWDVDGDTLTLTSGDVTIVLTRR